MVLESGSNGMSVSRSVVDDENADGLGSWQVDFLWRLSLMADFSLSVMKPGEGCEPEFQRAPFLSLLESKVVVWGCGRVRSGRLMLHLKPVAALALASKALHNFQESAPGMRKARRLAINQPQLTLQA